MRGLCYHLDADGSPSQKIRKDNLNDHAIDALRYAVMASARYKDLHGGRMLSQRFEDSKALTEQKIGNSSAQMFAT